jgi:hypothetical protein
MLLVLISLMTATIMATAYLSSRDNSPIIGDNVASAAAARWTALSGLELGVAILQTESNWRTAHVNGRLLEGQALGAGSFDLDLIDLATNAPPGEDTREVEMTATARVNGVAQVATARATILGGGANDPIDVDLREFALFAWDEITLRDRALVTRWPGAALSELGAGLAMGVGGTSAGTVEVSNEAVAIDTSVYHGPGASGSLVLNGSELPIDQVGLLDPLPAPLPPDPNVAPPGGAGPVVDIDANGDVITVNADARWGTVDLSASTRVVSGDVTVVAEGALRLDSASTLRIDGHVRLVAFDDLRLVSSSIELTEGSSLSLFVGHDLQLTNGYIGDQPEAGAVNDNTGGAAWVDPARLEIYEMSAGRTWQITGQSVVKGTIYAPRTTVGMDGQAALYGSMTAYEATLAGYSALFYDPGLDEHMGFTNLASKAYNADGTMLEAIRTLPSLNEADLLLAAALTGTHISAGSYSTADSMMGSVEPPPPVAEDQPTPRPVLVEFEFTGFGTTVSEWEGSSP